MSRLEGTVFLAGEELVMKPPDDLAPDVWDQICDAIQLASPLVEGHRARVAIEDGSRLWEALLRYPASKVRWLWEDCAVRQLEETASLRQALASVVQVPAHDQHVQVDQARLSDLGFKRSLRPFQQESLSRLLFMGNGADFSVPGAGKTTVAYALFAILRDDAKVNAMLVLAPPSAFEAWEQEAIDCFEDSARPAVGVRPALAGRDCEVLVLNYERLQRRRTYAEIDQWIGNRKVLLVFDEAHRAKAGRAGVRGRGARKLASQAGNRLVLTGTPMPNNEEDLEAVFDLVWPGQGRRLAKGDLRPTVASAYVRVTKPMLGLPKLSIRKELVELDPAHQRVYDALAGRSLELAQSGTRKDRVVRRAILQLLAAATSPSTLLEPEGDFKLPASPSQAKLEELLASPSDHVRPAKIVRAVQLATQNSGQGKKTLIWSSFVGNVRAMSQALGDLCPAVITGSTPLQDPSALTDRERELVRFRTDPACKVLIATPQTLGEGVSLHLTCQDQIHLDRGCSAGIYLQSLDRTHRLGLARDATPTCTVLIARNTIDERLHQLLAAKVTAMADALGDTSLRVCADPYASSLQTLEDVLLDQGSEAQLRELLAGVLR